MRVHVFTAGAVLMVVIEIGAVFQTRVQCTRLGEQAATERALRAGMERRLDEARRLLTQIAVAADMGQLRADAKNGSAKSLVEAVEDGIATRERQDAANQALLREIAGAGGSWRPGLSTTAMQESTGDLRSRSEKFVRLRRRCQPPRHSKSRNE
jgi:hypothetical protein